MNSALGGSLCDIVNHDDLRQASNEHFCFPLLPDSWDRPVFKEPSKMTYQINMYVPRSGAGIHCCAFNMSDNRREQISRGKKFTVVENL